MRPYSRVDRLRDQIPERPSRGQKQSRAPTKSAVFLSLLAASLPLSMAQETCIPLRSSTTCPGFGAASVSTNANLTGALYVDPHVRLQVLANNPTSSFLSFVSNVQTFDDRLRWFIATSYTEQKYVFIRSSVGHTSLRGHETNLRRYRNILGCSSVNLSNTTDLYARYTTTVLCNAIVQASREPCRLSNANATPLCAGACVRKIPSYAYHPHVRRR
jgi:hypothetical protein